MHFFGAWKLDCLSSHKNVFIHFLGHGTTTGFLKCYGLSFYRTLSEHFALKKFVRWNFPNKILFWKSDCVFANSMMLIVLITYIKLFFMLVIVFSFDLVFHSFQELWMLRLQLPKINLLRFLVIFCLIFSAYIFFSSA